VAVGSHTHGKGSYKVMKTDGPPDEATQHQYMMDNINSKKKKKVKLLASKYTRTKRIGEIISVCAYGVLISVSVIRISNVFFLKNIWVFLCACVLSMSMVDFFSGLAHWVADTWGSLETPIVGGTFIRSFREHHLVPTAMCKHDVFEVNGDNCMLVAPFLLLTASVTPKCNDIYYLFVHTFLMVTCFWVGITNQIHKWTHTYKLPKFVQFMMDIGIILSKKDHAVHHRNPFDKYYCITNGWLNPVLANINFWKRLEGVITFVTGYEPREDDMLWTGITAKQE